MANPEHLELALKGSKAIHKWRKKHPKDTLDLSNADLSEANLIKAKLSKANLSKANLIEAKLSKANLGKANLSNALLSGADLEGADLSNAILTKTNFFKSNLSKANLTQANLSNSNLMLANLCGSNLCSANLSKADLRQADLFKADLSKANISKANLLGADLFSANLSEAILVGANLSNTDLVTANLSKANLSRSDFCIANLFSANLSEANLCEADLFGAYFYDTVLTAAKFSRAKCSSTTFANCNLGDCRDLKSVIHEGPSSIGLDTLMRSRGTIPEVFLRGAGVPDTFIDFFYGSLKKGPRYYTCFISYGSPDAEFADRLYNDLAKKKVRCWKYSESALIGRGIWANIDRGISSYDKVIVICSKDSLNRTGVLNEIERALQKEETLRKENAKRIDEAKGKRQKPKLPDEDVLCPVRLDNYVFDEWKHPRKADVTKKHIGDFRGWKTNSNKYDSELRRLLSALDPKTWGTVKET